jgi:hypothetical protein
VRYQDGQRAETIPVEFIVERALYPADQDFRWLIVGISSELVQGEIPAAEKPQP